MKRSFLVFLLTLVTFSASVSVLLVIRQQSAFELRGVRDATLSADLPFRTDRFGVNADLTQYEGDELAIVLNQMQAAHVQWVRQMVPWQSIETERNRYDWTRWDEIVEAIGAHPELKLVAVLVGSPPWHADPRSSPKAALPQDPQNFADFAGAFAGRYGDQVDVYQIWDEPNLMDAWGGLNPSPQDYLALLSAAYQAIHAADSDAVVVAAALAPTTETGPRNLSDITFLRDLIALGGASSMDGAAAKPYGFSLPPTDRTVSPDTLNFSRIIALREVLEQAGLGRMPLWASAWGWNHLPDDWRGTPSIWGSVTQIQQIDYTNQALDRADREWPWLAGMILSTWQPNAPADHPVWGFALLDPSGETTPLYDALAARPVSETAANGLHFAQSPSAQYHGLWTFSPLGADIGWLNDSRLQFDFSGTDVSVLTRQGDYVGILYASVDGSPGNALPRDPAGNAFITLTSGTREPQIENVAIARGLGTEPHRLELTADRGWDQWSLVGFGVGSGDLSRPYAQSEAVAWAAVIVSGVSLLFASTPVRWRALTDRLGAVARLASDGVQLVAAVITSLALLAGLLLTFHGPIPEILRREPVPLILAVVTAGLAYFSPGILLTVAAVIVLFVLLYYRPVHGLALSIGFAPLYLFPVELYRFAFPMSELALMVTAAAAALRVLSAWGRARQSAVSQFAATPVWKRLQTLHWLDYGALAFFALGLVSLAISDVKSAAWTEFRTLFAEPFVFYVLIRVFVHSRRDALLLVDALLVTGAIICVIGLVQFAAGQAIITAEGGARRLAGVYGSPNNLALFLGRCLPFALAMALMPTDRNRRAAAAALVGLFLIVTGLTQSAGALFLGLPVGAAVVLLLHYRRRALTVLAGICAAGIALFVILTSTERFARLLTGEGTTFVRFRVWQSAIQMIRDHPMTGIGLDQFLYAYRGQYILPDAWAEPDLSHPHNLLLDHWLRLGIAGVIWLIVTQFVFFSAMLRLFRRVSSADFTLSAVIGGGIGAMAATLAHGMVDNSIFVQDLMLIFFLLLSLPSIIERILRTQPAD